jgi:putative PIN family toxin of toxin-antitoxin system
VLDTNVVLSALVFARGPTAGLRLAWQRGAFIPLVSASTVTELMRVLAYPKFKLDDDARRELIADYLPWTEVVHVPDDPADNPRCRDPFDLPLLHLAAAGRADALVTGDGDLLALAGRVAYAIVTPAEFAASLTQ